MQEKTVGAFGLDEDVDDIIGETFIQRSHIRDPWEAACLANREEEREESLQRAREWAREHGDCCTCFSSSWRPRLLPSKAIIMSGKSVSKVGKSIDWDYLQKVVVSDGGKRELAALRRAYDDVAATINDKFNIVSVTSRQILCSSHDLRSRSVVLAIS